MDNVFRATMKPMCLLLGLFLALPAAAAADPTTTMSADAVPAQASSPQPTSPDKLEHNPQAAVTTIKKHWWNPLPYFTKLAARIKGDPARDSDILQYHGLSSRPWCAISADPPYMSNDQDCRVHHSQFGFSGKY